MDQSSAYAVLRDLLKATAATSGEAFLAQACRAFAHEFAADFVFITRLLEVPSDTVEMLAAWRDGKAIAGWEFALAGTPCALIYKHDEAKEWKTTRVGSAIGIADEVCRKFTSTRQTSYQAFIGVPLWDANRKMIGHIAIFFNRSLNDEAICHLMLEILELFSLKVQAEMNRMLLEQEREKVLQEITRANDRLLHESITDALTGMFNRRYFMQRIQEAYAGFKRTAEPFVLIMIDVDRFKNVNDTYGHDAGDAVLRCLADTLRKITRSQTELSFRIGGEEFALLLPGAISPQELSVIGRRINQSVAQAVLPEALGQVRLTVSLGAAWPKVEDEGWDALYGRADAAMYQAKKIGGNSLRIDETA